MGKTVKDVKEFFSERCFDERRPDKKVLLLMLGVDSYNPEEICKRTHGIMTYDNRWIKYLGESLTYDDVKL